MALTCLPQRIARCLRGLGPCCRHRHLLVFRWLLVLHLVYGERANLKALARHGPAQLASQHYRRLLCAAYGCTKTLLWWFADHALQALPPPEDGLLYLVGDSTLKSKRGHKPPVAHQTRWSQDPPSVFGFRRVILMAQWDVYRIPLDCALLRRKDALHYPPENALFRQLRPDFQQPARCQEVGVTAAAAYAARVNLALMQALEYGYVRALPHTWKFANGKALKALVTHRLRWQDTQLRIPTVNTPCRRTC
jgi:hypothetical protein